MKRINRTIQINAPAQRAFDVIAQPTNLPSIMPSLVEVSNVVAKPGGGYDFDWVYKMAGVHLRGHSKQEEFQTGRLSRVRTEGGVVSTWTWKFDGDGAGTRLTLDIEYTIPVPVLGKLAEAIVAKMNERETDVSLAHLKEIAEAGGVGVATAPQARR